MFSGPFHFCAARSARSIVPSDAASGRFSSDRAEARMLKRTSPSASLQIFCVDYRVREPLAVLNLHCLSLEPPATVMPVASKSDLRA